jgi:DNA-binding NarL/FixJ family response regulator
MQWAGFSFILLTMNREFFHRTGQNMRVILADGHQNVLTALRLTIEEEPQWRVAAEASKAGSLLSLVAQNPPDLLLLDASLPGRRMEDLLKELRLTHPELMIVVLSSRPENHHPALHSGANAFVSKGNPPEDLLKTLHTLMD